MPRTSAPVCGVSGVIVYSIGRYPPLRLACVPQVWQIAAGSAISCGSLRLPEKHASKQREREKRGTEIAVTEAALSV